MAKFFYHGLHLFDRIPLLDVLRAIDVPGFEMEDEHPSRPRVVVTVGHAIQQFRVILDELGRAPDLDAVLIGVVEAGRFREDLFYRLSVFPVEAAPLRQRPDDVGLLAAHFLGQACRRLGVPARPLKQRHVEALQSYPWPGNIRELQNVVERAVIGAKSGPLEFDLPQDSHKQQRASGAAEQSKSRISGILNYSELKSRERDNLLAALQATRWRVSGPAGAAKLLGLRPTTLASKIKTLRLREEKTEYPGGS